MYSDQLDDEDLEFARQSFFDTRKESRIIVWRRKLLRGLKRAWSRFRAYGKTENGDSASIPQWRTLSHHWHRREIIFLPFFSRVLYDSFPTDQRLLQVSFRHNRTYYLPSMQMPRRFCRMLRSDLLLVGLAFLSQ